MSCDENVIDMTLGRVLFPPCSNGFQVKESVTSSGIC